MLLYKGAPIKGYPYIGTLALVSLAASSPSHLPWTHHPLSSLSAILSPLAPLPSSKETIQALHMSINRDPCVHTLSGEAGGRLRADGSLGGGWRSHEWAHAQACGRASRVCIENPKVLPRLRPASELSRISFLKGVLRFLSALGASELRGFLSARALTHPHVPDRASARSLARVPANPQVHARLVRRARGPAGPYQFNVDICTDI